MTSSSSLNAACRESLERCSTLCLCINVRNPSRTGLGLMRSAPNFPMHSAATRMSSIERIGKLFADGTKPRLVRLVFGTPNTQAHLPALSKDSRQPGARLDVDLTRSQQAERKSLSLNFQSLKIKVHQVLYLTLASAVP